MLADKRVLLIVAGGAAAYKSLELTRRLREARARVRIILTDGGAQFVTPMSLAALSNDTVYQDLFSLTSENDMGHIRLSRDADLLVVVPATADIMAKMAAGLADDLATTTLLATDKLVMVVPAMNVRMWHHPATQANLETLRGRGVLVTGPEEGDMACGEFGMGRMAEPEIILEAISRFLGTSARLAGRRALVTSGPTVEAIDPARYIANRSSGKQGHAVARALAGLGAETTLVSGPTRLDDPPGVNVVHVESARDMLAACERSLPADIAVCAAAVADWRVANEARQKIRKTAGEGEAMPLALTLNPDILKTLGAMGNCRPQVLVGFAAETEDVIDHARHKLATKGCDWIVANDVSAGTGTFGGDENTVHLVSSSDVENWPRARKQDIATRLAERIADRLEGRR